MAILLMWTSILDFLPSKTGYFLFCRSVLYISKSHKCQSELHHQMVTCLVFSSYVSLSSLEFFPEISSKTAGWIFANKVSCQRSLWGVAPSVILIGLTGLMFKLLPKIWTKFALWISIVNHPHICHQAELAEPTSAPLLQSRKYCSSNQYIFIRNFPYRQASYSVHPKVLIIESKSIVQSTELCPPFYY